MADAVSKLYAEIGFKVKQDGLKELKATLKDITRQMDKFNKSAKQAARNYGIFSKNAAKQEMHNAKMATEASRKALIDKRKQIMGIKELDRQNDRATREREKEERRIQREKSKADRDRAREEKELRREALKEKKKQEREEQRIAREEQRRNEKIVHERKKALRAALGATSDFVKGIARGIRASSIGFSRLLYSGVKESLGRSIATRDFMMMTGANLADIQSVMGRFASIGESVDQETIMGDLTKLSQNIAGIALGQGNLSAYKLLGTAVKRGDISGMIRGIGMAGQGIDNDFFAKLLGDIGLPSYWLPFFKAQGGGKEITNFIDQAGQEEILKAKGALGTLSVAFKNLADWMTATLSPTLVEISGGLQDWIQEMSESLKGETGRKLSQNLKEIADRIVDFVKEFDANKVISAITTFVGALEWVANKIISIAKKFGYVPESEKEQYMQDYANKLNARGLPLQAREWLLNREMTKIGYRPTNSTSYIDNRVINSTVTVDSEGVVDAVKNEAIKFGGLSIDPRSIAAISGLGGNANG